MVANVVVADIFAKHLRATGRVVDEPRPNQRMGSTDMGDISQIMPAVHAYLSIAPRDVPNHTVEFTEAAASPAGDQAVVDGALAMAQTAADLLRGPVAGGAGAGRVPGAARTRRGGRVRGLGRGRQGVRAGAAARSITLNV